jgi:hypothetical protein
VEFTGVELTSGAELAAPLEKAASSLVEKAAVVRALEKVTTGGRRSGEGGRPAAALGHCRDAGRRSGGVMDREARWRARSPRQCGGALS